MDHWEDGWKLAGWLLLAGAFTSGFGQLLHIDALTVLGAIPVVFGALLGVVLAALFPLELAVEAAQWWRDRRAARKRARGAV